MSIHKITPFLSDIKKFFDNSDMTAAMPNKLEIPRITNKNGYAIPEGKRNRHPDTGNGSIIIVNLHRSVIIRNFGE